MKTDFRNNRLPVWMLPNIWGLDVPLAVTCWGMMFAEACGILVLGCIPFIILFTLVWAFTSVSRLCPPVSAAAQFVNRYRREHFWQIFSAACAALSIAAWLLLFKEGLYLISFFIAPIFFMLMAYLPYLRQIAIYRAAVGACALAWACAAPAYYYGVVYMPIQVVADAKLWCLMLLLFVAEAAFRKNLAIFLLSGLLMYCCCRITEAETCIEEQHFYIIMALAALLLSGCDKWCASLPPSLQQAVNWGLVCVPPVMGILLYRAVF